MPMLSRYITVFRVAQGLNRPLPVLWLNTKWDEVRKRREEFAILTEKEAEEAEMVGYFLSFTLHFIPYTNTLFRTKHAWPHLSPWVQ
jgi:hypothetical protein